MSEATEKPFEPTPQRLSRARREGDVARAAELSANVAFAAAGISTAAIIPLLGGIARDAIGTAARGQNPVAQALALVGAATIPAVACAIAAVLAAALQGGGLRFTAITIKAERLNPLEGLRKILSRESASRTLRALLAFAFASAGMMPVLSYAAQVTRVSLTPGATAAAAWHAALQVGAIACGTGAFFAIAEFFSARNAWRKRLRMSFDERKRESKEQEGDPHARGRRRALHRSLLQGGMARVRDAAFVVTNPTHVAVALEYRPPYVPVPRVLVRGEDGVARAVREAARAFGIPIVENVALARSLFRDARPGDFIPHAHYVAVAEIVTALLRSGELA